MKKRFYLIVAGCIIILSLVVACSEDTVNRTRQGGCSDVLSVAEARRYFERMAVPTRAGEEEGALTLGVYTPDWSQAEISEGGVLYSADVPVQGEYRYYLYRLDEYGKPRFSPIYHKLVVVKECRTGEMASYLRFYVPDPDYAAGRMADDYDRLLNSASKEDFTGLSIYTTLDGYPVSAARYDGGALQEAAFLYDGAGTQAENTAHLNDMLDGLRVGCSRDAAVTRAEAESEMNGKIDVVEIYGIRPVNTFKYLQRPPIDPTEQDRLGGGDSGGGSSSGGGGGGGTGGNFVIPGSMGYNRYRGNENIFLAAEGEDQLEPLLDSLRKDCMAEKIIGSIHGHVGICTGFFGSSVMVPTAYIFGEDTVWNDFDIKMGSRVDDITLLEELFHTHQCSGKTLEQYRGMRLNNEIEAKLCWYMYRLKIGNLSGINKYMSEGEGRRIFGTLSKYVMSGDIKSDNFQKEYRNAAFLLRKMSHSYANATLYPFSEEALNVDVLMKMIEDCPEYKNM